MRFAAIDIGSNAIRLLFTNVYQTDGEPMFRKESLIRVPLRLGADAFLDGKISRVKAAKLEDTLLAFDKLMGVCDVLDYKACATAAMREASNGDYLLKRIKEQTGIDVRLIEGEQEAEIIYSNQIINQLDPSRNYIYIDVGGGSTEISIFTNAQLVASRSFAIGTLKILNNLVDENQWDELKAFLKAHRKKYDKIYGIGTGGNINKLYKIYGKQSDTSISKAAIKKAYDIISGYSYAERVQVLGFKPDRADVIIPASEIFMFIMKHSGISKIYVPKVGLADGLVHVLYHEYKDRVEVPSLF